MGDRNEVKARWTLQREAHVVGTRRSRSRLLREVLLQHVDGDLQRVRDVGLVPRLGRCHPSLPAGNSGAVDFQPAAKVSWVYPIAAQVGWYEVGATIPLPAFGSVEGELRWVQQPEAGLELPNWGAVVGAVRRTFSRAW